MRCGKWLALGAAVTVALVGCKGCPPCAPDGGPCEGYACTQQGAARMLRDVADSANLPAVVVHQDLEPLLRRAVGTMEENGLTPESFRRARSNFRRFFAQGVHGANETAARELEQLRYGRHFLCPLWPFC